jgi:hypothetical protein
MFRGKSFSTRLQNNCEKKNISFVMRIFLCVCVETTRLKTEDFQLNFILGICITSACRKQFWSKPDKNSRHYGHVFMMSPNTTTSSGLITVVNKSKIVYGIFGPFNTYTLQI